MCVLFDVCAFFSAVFFFSDFFLRVFSPLKFDSLCLCVVCIPVHLLVIAAKSSNTHKFVPTLRTVICRFTFFAWFYRKGLVRCFCFLGHFCFFSLHLNAIVALAMLSSRQQVHHFSHFAAFSITFAFYPSSSIHAKWYGYLVHIGCN